MATNCLTKIVFVKYFTTYREFFLFKRSFILKIKERSPKAPFYNEQIKRVRETDITIIKIKSDKLVMRVVSQFEHNIKEKAHPTYQVKIAPFKWSTGSQRKS